MISPRPSPEATSLPTAVIEAPRSSFGALYNRSNFGFTHTLGTGPLFELPALIELSGRRAPTPNYAYWSRGKVALTDGWEKGSSTSLSLQDAIADIPNNDSLVMLKHVEEDAVYGPLLRQIFLELGRLVGPAMTQDVIVGRGTILIASPKRITSYHLDADVNFLFQVKGDKTFDVFDGTRPDVVSSGELETYFSGDQSAAKYLQDKQQHAKRYELAAGSGVHVPCLSPHWAQNASNVSVALSVNFDLKSIARLGRLHKMNARLRRLGASPHPPGSSKLRDRMKLASFAALSAAKGLIGRRAPASP
jgi:hypothetical protein